LLTLKHATTILRLMINVHSAVNFLFYIKKPLYFPTMCFTVLCWNILSIVTNNATIMVLASVFLIYPFYVVDHVQVVVATLDSSEISRYLKPFTMYTYPTMIGLISLYMALLFTQNEAGVSSLFEDRIGKLEEKNKDNDSTFLHYIESFRDLVMEPLESIYRYVTLMISIMTALHSISILSSILVIFSLIFIWKESLDRKYWVYFTGYTILHIFIKQAGHYLIERARVQH
jgi:hypothetical protein